MNAGEQRREQRGRGSQQQRNASAVKQAREAVPSQFVGAERKRADGGALMASRNCSE